MDVRQKLDFLEQLIRCCHDISLRSYPPQLLSESGFPGQASDSDSLLILLNLEAHLRKHIRDNAREPLFLADQLGLIWIAGLEYQEDSLKQIHILGPAYSGKNSFQVIRGKLEEHNLSVAVRARMFRIFQHIPVIPTNQLFQYAVMLHYCITGQRISTNDIRFAEESGRISSSSEANLITTEHRGIWMAEQEFMNMLREGNPNYLEALARSSSMSNGPRFDIGDSLRSAKSTAIVLLTLCSRASIEGGVSSAVAYTLNDYYMQMIEDCQSIPEVTNTCNTMLADSVQRVRQSKSDSSLSLQIRNACDYISLHIREKLSMDVLAKEAGYTEYYFSHKFKQEMGVSVADYIRREKVRQAKLLLSGTKMNIQEISDELNFGSRSYFSSTFQKEAGMSPSEYRERNRKE